ncbi:hypothetical protein [Ascidiimonas sp. W6]|uniref:hypothetical protein n=1 Tax=Ascidiimonas meishanensis TaxID=3128903 RepID=UPI0030EC64D4
MNAESKQALENKSTLVPNEASQRQRQHQNKAVSPFIDHRRQAITQRNIQEIANDSSQIKQLKGLQNIANNYAQTQNNQQAIQLKPATAVGSTHIVPMNGKSLMRAEKGEFITSGTPLDVDPNTRVISRRGPNQELVKDYDTRGEHMYRWYKIDEYNGNNIAANNEYIREHTFKFNENNSEPEKAHKNLDANPDKRSRQSHVAIRYDVWFNSNRAIDRTAHMVMEDYSAHHRKENPMYEYTWGENKEIPRDSPIAEPTPMGGDIEESKIHKDSIEMSGGLPNAMHKELLRKQESHKDKEESMKGQKRYESSKTKGKFFMNPPKSNPDAQPIPRFNKVKSVEILVTMEEYNMLKGMYELRRKGGFYCLYREARTVHGYELATRCLSFLEDIAIKRKQLGLKPGHGADVLKKFAELNKVTNAHQGEKDV